MRKSEGRYQCWGDNTLRVLDIPNQYRDAEKLVSHFHQLCAMKEEKIIGCWGEVGSNLHYFSQSTSLKKIISVGNFNCGLSFEGEFACWGEYNLFLPSELFRKNRIKDFEISSNGICFQLEDKLLCRGFNYTIGDRWRFLSPAKFGLTQIEGFKIDASEVCAYQESNVKCIGTPIHSNGKDRVPELKQIKKMVMDNGLKCALDSDVIS